MSLELRNYVDEIDDDSQRGRRLVTQLMVATMLTIIALVNSLSPPYNWLKSRLVAEQNAYPYLIFSDEDCDSIYLNETKSVVANSFSQIEFIQICNSELHISNLEIQSNIGNNYKLKFPRYMLEERLISKKSDSDSLSLMQKNGKESKASKVYNLKYSIGCEETINRTLIYLGAGRNYTSRKELDRRLFALEKDILETTGLIKIPILGLSFDVNLLCIFSALTFSILYYLLYHARMRERKNLTLVFLIAPNLAEENKTHYDIVKLYQFLTMQQVLTIPPSIDEAITNSGDDPSDVKWRIVRKRFWRLFVGQIPIFLPMAIWILSFVYDIKTMDFGNSINGTLTIWHVIISTFFGTICFILCRKCYVEYRKIDSLWEEKAEEAKKAWKSKVKPIE